MLLVVFMVAAMLIATLASLPRLAIQGRRQKEAELAWRGQQYVRAIRLYYRKYGHFPRSVEDFSKNPGNIHFLRKEYKDPMNATDGSWRYIYIGPGGQLVGSLTRKMPIGMIPLQAGVPGALGNPASPNQSGLIGAPRAGSNQPGSSSFGGNSSIFGSDSSAQTQTQPQTQPPSPPPSGDASAASSGDSEAQLPPAPEAPKQAIQGASTADSTVYGGQLVGIGSKVDRKSIRFYKGYGKYREWEFIWDPAEDAAAAGALVPQGPGGLPGSAQPLGTQPVVTPPIVTPPVNPNNPQP